MASHFTQGKNQSTCKGLKNLMGSGFTFFLISSLLANSFLPHRAPCSFLNSRDSTLDPPSAWNVLPWNTHGNCSVPHSLFRPLLARSPAIALKYSIFLYWTHHHLICTGMYFCVVRDMSREASITVTAIRKGSATS